MSLSLMKRLFRVRTSLDVIRQVLRRDSLDDDQSYGKVPAWRRPYRLTWSLMAWLSCLTFVMLRICLLSVSLLLFDRNPSLYRAILRFDPTIATIDRRLVHHSLFGLSWCPIGALCFFLLSLIHLKPNRRIWKRTVGPLMFTNRRHFFRLNPEYRLTDLSLRERVKGFVLVVYHLWYCNKATFDTPQLPHYPNLSVRVRTRAVVIVWLWHHYEQFFFSTIVLFFTFIWLRVTWLISFDYDPFLVVIGSVDVGLALATFYHAMQNSFFLSTSSILVAFTAGGQLSELQSQLTNLLSSIRPNHLTLTQTRRLSLNLAIQLAQFREANCRTLNDAIAVNDGAGSTAMLLCFALLLVFSIYFVSVVFFRAIAPFAIFLFTVYMVCFNMVTGLNVVPMIYHVDRLYANGPLFGQVVRYLEAPGLASAKLKASHHYEVLHTHHKHYYTIGTLAPLCWDTLFQFALLYTGYLMYSFNMFIKRKLV